MCVCVCVCVRERERDTVSLFITLFSGLTSDSWCCGTWGIQWRGTEGHPTPHITISQRRLTWEHERRHGHRERYTSAPGSIPEKHRRTDGMSSHISCTCTQTRICIYKPKDCLAWTWLQFLVVYFQSVQMQALHIKYTVLWGLVHILSPWGDGGVDKLA